MDIFHTIVIKVASIVSAILLFVGNGPVAAPRVTLVEVQDNKVTITESTSTSTSTFSPEPAKSPEVTTVPVQTTETAPTIETALTAPQIQPQTVYVPVYVYQSAPAVAGSAPLPTNPPTTMEPEPTPEVTPVAPVKVAQILIKNPIPGKGFKPGREYRFRSEPLDESNEVQLGAVLVNSDGSINNTAVVTVTASDESQNKTIDGTGNVSSFGDPNNQQHYYPYRYVFYEPGPHTITFASEGVEASITIDNVVEDTRP